MVSLIHLYIIIIFLFILEIYTISILQSKKRKIFEYLEKYHNKFWKDNGAPNLWWNSIRDKIVRYILYQPSKLPNDQKLLEMVNSYRKFSLSIIIVALSGLLIMLFVYLNLKF